MICARGVDKRQMVLDTCCFQSVQHELQLTAQADYYTITLHENVRTCIHTTLICDIAVQHWVNLC